ncbi:hypothetical protein GLYMA_04G153000v4 [Glycine max]|uniref:K-box domain-containing protein n=1 Tax=Glycine max TaxID=3847 RepID=K7KK50_SOYBN|nr:hypothetical protein JHK87_010150 [Glycine soja]KAH1111479.1 hypothetical protein GYH30_010035 [Glycine max]KRH63068.1 hypothetical protein GLYMA_04G153000v4 [Glycine max]
MIAFWNEIFSEMVGVTSLYIVMDLSQLNGEEFQGLTIKELQKLEELLQRHWTTISKIKGPRSKDRRY